MNLAGRSRKKQGKSIKHYYTKRLPAALTEDETARLVPIYKSNPNDAQVRERLVLGHMRLGMRIASEYVDGRSNVDDLVSAMSEGVVEGVRLFAANGIEHDNIYGYIMATVHRKISESLERQEIVYVPGSTNRKRKERGQEYIPAPVLVDAHNPMIEQQMFHYDSSLQNLECEELADRICVNEQEREVLRLRREGLSDAETGEAMGLNRRTIHVIRQSIQRRTGEYFNVAG